MNYSSLKKQIIQKDFASMNDRQFEAVVHTHGPLLILAGAGSGKTTVLVNRIANLIKYGDAFESKFLPSLTERQAEMIAECAAGTSSYPEEAKALLAHNPARPWEILAITFTNKAAGELKERLEKMLGSTALNIWAATFHATCGKILRRYGDRIGYSSHFTIYDTDDQKRVIKECQKELGIDEKILPHKSILNEISRAKDSLIEPDGYLATAGSDYRRQQIGQVYALYQKKLTDADAMDFDDMIMQTVRLFTASGDILEYYQNKFQYIMVDEYQDTNHAQYMLIKLLAAKHRNICVVGDDDQSIYRFRGATIENILGFEKEYPDARVIRLEQNYRSTERILNAANSVIANNLGRKGKNLWTQNGKGEKIELYTASDEQEEARFVADTILENLEKGGRFGQHAVLYRMNAQSNALENVLARSGIPYRIIGSLRFYDRKEIKDVLAYLQFIINPTDNLRLQRIINEPKRGIGDATVGKAASIAGNLGVPLYEVFQSADQYDPLKRSAAKLRAFCEKMNPLIEKADSLPPHELLELTLDRSGYLMSLMALGKEEQHRVENVNELSSSILAYENENEEPTMAGFLEEVALQTDLDTYNDDGTAEQDRVVLMTLHSAKGLEFPYVFLVGMEEGIFPGNQSIYSGPDEIEEERRLAYVGITRAKKRLYLTHCGHRMLFGMTNRNRVSRFVTEIPPECLEKKHAAPVSAFMGEREAFAAPAHKPRHTGYIPASPNQQHFSPGDRVVHKTFGAGLVVTATPMGNDTLLEIAFDGVGIKKLMANFAKIQRE